MASACLAKEGYGLNRAEEIKTEGKQEVKEGVVGGINKPHDCTGCCVGGCSWGVGGRAKCEGRSLMTWQP